MSPAEAIQALLAEAEARCRRASSEFLAVSAALRSAPDPYASGVLRERLAATGDAWARLSGRIDGLRLALEAMQAPSSALGHPVEIRDPVLRDAPTTAACDSGWDGLLYGRNCDGVPGTLWLEIPAGAPGVDRHGPGLAFPLEPEARRMSVAAIKAAIRLALPRLEAEMVEDMRRKLGEEAADISREAIAAIRWALGRGFTSLAGCLGEDLPAKTRRHRDDVP